VLEFVWRFDKGLGWNGGVFDTNLLFHSNMYMHHLQFYQSLAEVYGIGNEYVVSKFSTVWHE
jgi:hypothetical protein